MRPACKIFLSFVLALSILCLGPQAAAAQEPQPTGTQTPEPRLLTVNELLQMVNQARASIGHPPLVLDPILMNYIQAEADLAANSLPSQGSPTERVIAMGYGYPETSDTIFCTSNSAIMDINGIPSGYGSVDERAVNNVYYRHIGFGISKGVGDWDGYVFYMLLACYDADKKYHPGQATVTPGANATAGVSEVIIPVRTAEAQQNGQILHEVRSGQTLWAIAMAYHTHIQDILTLNRLSPDTDTIYQGQKLLIPTLPVSLIRHSSTPLPFTITPTGHSSLMPARESTTAITAIKNTTSPRAAQSGEFKINNNMVIFGILVLSGLALVLFALFKK
jgi:LysM repeat protein